MGGDASDPESHVPRSHAFLANGDLITATPHTTRSDNGLQFSVVVSNRAGSVTKNAATSYGIKFHPAAFRARVHRGRGKHQLCSSDWKCIYAVSQWLDKSVSTQYNSNTHPSIGNYFMLTTGQVLTNNDGEVPQSFPVSADNAVPTWWLTWKAYAEDLPSVCYTGGNSGNSTQKQMRLTT